MPVHGPHADFDDPGDLPLVTESATVERFEALDRSRNDEIERAVFDLLDVYGEERWHRRAADGHTRVDWSSLGRALDEGEVPGGIADDVQMLRERHARPYPSLATLELDVGDDVRFVPGQYVTFRFEGTPRPYSVASPPNGDTMELCIRRVPGGALTGELFEHADPGDQVTVRGPSGEFVMRSPSRRDLAFLATGTGVAPLKSMIEHTFEAGRDVHRGTEREVWLFLGASWADDLPYRERFRELDDRHDNFHFVPTCTREALLSDWDGEDDYVQRVLVTYLLEDADVGGLPSGLRPYLRRSPNTDVAARLDPGNLEVYACGLNAMVFRLEAAVSAIGVPDRHFSAEGYG